MRRKILFALLLMAVFTCLFAISISAATPSMYIEFGARFPDSNGYITVYTENAESTGNPRIDFKDKKFYSDVDFTQEVDMSTATGIDFSVTKTYVNGVEGNAVTRMVKPSTPFTSCEEVKWFLAGMPTISYNGAFFQGWTNLKYFDFGNATAVADNTFEGCGFEELVIPSTITKLASRSFAGNTNLKSVRFEGSTELAGNANAFYGCTSLVSVDLGTVPYIGKGTFGECAALESIVIPSSVTEIKDGAFQNCIALSSVVLPSTLKSIGANAFNSCSGLTSIDIPEGVTTIGNSAFLSTAITSFHVPASVVSIGYQAIEFTPVTTITFAPNSQLKSIGHRCFSSCKSLTGAVIIPDGVETLGYNLFGSSTVEAVKIPNTVTDIGTTAMFGSCTNLKFVQLSNQLTYIPPSMFEGCTSLKAISFPDSITTIDYKALRNCTSLEAIYLPSGLIKLGRANASNDWGVFYQSSNVYFVDEPFEVFNGDTYLGDNFVMPTKPAVYWMPSGLQSLESSEFQNCSKINDTIVFPTGVTSAAGANVNQGAFFNTGNGRTTPVTFVFLGDMTALNIRQNDSSYKNINFVFAHPNDKDLNCLTVTIGAANNQKQTNSYMYFCAGGVSYDLSSFVATNAQKHVVQETDYTKTVYTAETQPHFKNPDGTKETEATCIMPKMVADYCFCGKYIPGTETPEGDALGHNLGEAYYIFTTLTEKGKTCKDCLRCGEFTEETEHENAILTDIGYSVMTFETGNGTASFDNGYTIDNELLAIYEATKGTTVTFGVAFNAYDGFDFDGTLDSFKVKSDIVASSDADFGAFAYKVIYSDASRFDSLIVIGVYARENEALTFVNADNGVFASVSYNSVLNSAQ